MIVAARANRLDAIDGPNANFRDLDDYRTDATWAATLGAVGKWAIHPSQIAIANEVFSPTADEIAQAERVIAAVREAEASGAGAASVDGHDDRRRDRPDLRDGPRPSDPRRMARVRTLQPVTSTVRRLDEGPQLAAEIVAGRLERDLRRPGLGGCRQAVTPVGRRAAAAHLGGDRSRHHRAVVSVELREVSAMDLEMADRRVDRLDRLPPHGGTGKGVEARSPALIGRVVGDRRAGPCRSQHVLALGILVRRRAPFRTPATPTSRTRRSGSSRARRRPTHAPPLHPSGRLRRSRNGGSIGRGGACPCTVQHRHHGPVDLDRLTAQERADRPDVVGDVGPLERPLPERMAGGEAGAERVRGPAGRERFEVGDRRRRRERMTVARDEHARPDPDPAPCGRPPAPATSTRRVAAEACRRSTPADSRAPPRTGPDQGCRVSAAAHTRSRACPRSTWHVRSELVPRSSTCDMYSIRRRRHSTEHLSACTLTSVVWSSGSTPSSSSSIRLSSAPIARSKRMTSSADTEKSSLRHTTNVKYEVTSSIGRRQQQQDVLEAGAVANRAAHVERQVEPRAHRPLDDAVDLAAGERAEIGVVRPHLVAVAEPTVVERFQLEPRHPRVLRPPERADVHEREVGDVEEVVGHPRRRRPPHVDRGVDAAERRIVLVGDDGDAVGPVDRRAAEAHPDQAVALGAAERGQVRARRRGHVLGGRGHADASAVVAERPAVVRTDEAAVVDRPDRQRRLTMRAPVGRGDDRAVAGAVQHDMRVEQRDCHRRGCRRRCCAPPRTTRRAAPDSRRGRGPARRT